MAKLEMIHETPPSPREPSSSGALMTADDQKQIEFLQWNAPALPAGDYLLRVDETVLAAPPSPDPSEPPAPPATEVYRHERKLTVQGSRFSLPSAAIETRFPPDKTTGEYDQVLPHIVFSEKTLPWQRKLGSDPADMTPWLAVLLFDADAPLPAGAAHAATLNDLGHGPGSSLPSTSQSYCGKSAEIALESGQLMTDPCRVIDLDKALFLSLAPSAADLALLAHARIVEKISASALNDDAGEEPGNYAVLCSNRIALKGGAYQAHVVSLEGLGALLPAADYTEPSDAWGSSTAIRLVSLASWAFVCKDPAESFTGYLSHLNPAALANAAPAKNATPEGKALASAYSAGFTLLPHSTRMGESTVSWYRGPLLPMEPAASSEPNARLSFSPDGLIRYDPSMGIMDMSHAAAWQMGQLLALQDVSFARAMLGWKSSLAQTAARLSWSAQLSGALLPPDPCGLSSEASAPHTIERTQQRLDAATSSALLTAFNILRGAQK